MSLKGSNDEGLSKKRRNNDSDETSSCNSGDSQKKSGSKKLKKSSSEHKLKRKSKKKEKKCKKGKDKERKREKKHKKKDKVKEKEKEEEKEEESIGPDLPSGFVVEEDKARSLAPTTKEQWEAKQKDVRRVLDEETGRYRIVRGDGEILEEIVSRERHKEINRKATLGDGAYFQTVLSNKKAV